MNMRMRREDGNGTDSFLDLRGLHGFILFAPFCMNDDVSSVEYSIFSGMDTAMEHLIPLILCYYLHMIFSTVTTPVVWFIQPEDLGGVSLRGVG